MLSRHDAEAVVYRLMKIMAILGKTITEGRKNGSVSSRR